MAEMIMMKLRESTREQHEDLEKVVDVMRDSLNIEDYGRLLLKFHRFYKPAEENLSKVDLVHTGYDFERRRKLPALEEDLEHLGLMGEAEAGRFPAFSGAPAPKNAAEAFGVLYVIEGATLGGQIIMRHLREHLGIEPGSGGSFFNGYGRDTGEMWKEFGRTAEEFVAVHGSEDEIVNAAKAAFDSFRICFSEASAAS